MYLYNNIMVGKKIKNIYVRKLMNVENNNTIIQKNQRKLVPIITGFIILFDVKICHCHFFLFESFKLTYYFSILKFVICTSNKFDQVPITYYLNVF